ncbi:hypothetical protein CHUAL_007015 [Chamberlinius hualienensis]
MNRNSFPVFYGKITLDGCIVPYELIIVHEDASSGNTSDDLHGFCDEHSTETLDLLNGIARKLINGHDYEERITSLNGKYVKLAFVVCKENSRLNGSGSRSYLTIDYVQGDDVRCKELVEFNCRIKASVYALPNSNKKLKDDYAPEQVPISQSSDRVAALEKIFANRNLSVVSSNEQKLQESIEELELQYEALKQSGIPEVKASKVKLKQMRQLTDDEIREQFSKCKNELISISVGKLQCQRHLDYTKGGLAKRNLDHQCYFLRFHKRQIDLAVKCLESIFVEPNGESVIIESQTLDYIMRVLLPEFLARLCMNLRNVSYEDAEKKLCGDSLSENETETFLADLTQES